MLQIFQETIEQQVDDIFPLQTMTLNLSDEPWTTFKMKHLKKLRMAEYRLNGKSNKYEDLVKQFKEERQKALDNFIKKNVDDALANDPRKAFKAIDKLGQSPGSFSDRFIRTSRTYRNVGQNGGRGSLFIFCQKSAMSLNH